MGSIGSSSTQQYPQDLNNYTQIRRQNNGMILNEKQSGMNYFLKIISFVNKKQYQLEYQRLKNLQGKSQHQNILAFVKFYSQYFHTICSTSYKIYTLYQYPEITLQQEIITRNKQNKHFQQCQLWSILQSCANALTQLNPAISLHPRNIHIVSDGTLKVINNAMINQDYRCFIKPNVYYAPQKMNEFKKIDSDDLLRKQSIFCLGMTVLHAVLLHDVYDCYNYQNYSFQQSILEQYMEKIICMKKNTLNSSRQSNRMYSEQFIQTLAMILQPYPNKRVSLMEVHAILNRVWNTQSSQNNEQYENQQHFLSQSQQQSTQRQRLPSKNKNIKEQNNSVLPSQTNTNVPQQSSNPTNQTSCQSPNFLPTFHQPFNDSNPSIHKLIAGSSQQNLAIPPQNTQKPTHYNQSSSIIPSYRPLNTSQQFLTSIKNPKQVQNKQNNLYTDPKLLEMIRKNLINLSQMKKSSKISNNGSDLYYFGNINQSYSTFGENNTDRNIKNGGGNINNISHHTCISNISNGNLTQRNQNILPLQFQEKQQICIKQEQNDKDKDKLDFSKKNAVYMEVQYNDGRKFQGMMINGVKEGHGKLTYSDGAFYEGNFKNNKMEGQGTLFYEARKPAYEGAWVQDQFHGYGILYNESPLQLEGCYNYNDFNSIEDFWIRYQGTHNSSIGNFERDNKCGKGKLLLSNGEQFTGNFNNDFINGEGIFYTKRGQKIKGVWQENILMEINT